VAQKEHLTVVDDSWSTDDGSGYSPEQFYTATKNRHDHGERVTLRMPPDVHAESWRVINDPKMPMYETFQDLLRDALIHRLRWLDDNIGLPVEVSEWLRVEMLRGLMATEQKRMESSSRAVEELDLTFEMIVKLGDWGLTTKMIETARDNAQTMREPYRSQMMTKCADFEKRMPRGERDGGIR
jgi:hypothetical protein